MDIEIVYMLRTIHLRYCGPTKEQTYGLKTTKEIGEIQLAHVVVIFTLREILMSYFHGNGYI
jgi:hypothetical protein